MSLSQAVQERLEDLASRPLRPVLTAVMDSGVDAAHPDLAGKVVQAYSVRRSEDRWVIMEEAVSVNNDVYGHGTAVAGIITGLAPNARIVDVRVLDAKNVGAGDATIAGFQHLLKSEIPLINMSLAVQSRFAPRLNALCEKAYVNHQMVVAARRNMPLADDGFPAEFSSVISVDSGGFPNVFQLKFRKRHKIEFIAHGEDVRVPAAGGGYTIRTGTSLAAPAVTGLTALLLGAYPDLMPFDVKSLLREFSVK